MGRSATEESQYPHATPATRTEPAFTVGLHVLRDLEDHERLKRVGLVALLC